MVRSAAAGAKAGVYCLAGRSHVNEVEIPLPPGERLTIPISSSAANGKECSVTVIKDAGDDPDVTHRSRITSIVRFLTEGDDGVIIVKVGKITRRGLKSAFISLALTAASLQTGRMGESINEKGAYCGTGYGAS